ncbi:MAG: hypothetical protein WA231_07280 [Methylocella sp.]
MTTIETLIIDILHPINHILHDNLGPAFVLGGVLTTLLIYAIVGVWGAIHGHFITNVSLALETKRVSIRNSDKHELVTTIKIEKGSVHALTVQTLKIELFSLKQDSLDQNISQWRLLDYKQSDELLGKRRVGDIWVPPRRKNRSRSNNRSLNAAGSPYNERHVLAIWTPHDDRAENLAPSERTQYASYSTIEADGIYEVVVTLAGIRYNPHFFRWFFEIFYLLFYILFNYQRQRAYYTASAISIQADAVQR